MTIRESVYTHATVPVIGSFGYEMRRNSSRIEKYPIWYLLSDSAGEWWLGGQPRIRYTKSFANEVNYFMEVHREDAEDAAFLGRLLETEYFPCKDDALHAADLMGMNGIELVTRYVHRKDLTYTGLLKRAGQSDELYDLAVLQSELPKLPKTYTLQRQLAKMAGVGSRETQKRVSKAARFRSMAEMNRTLSRMVVPRLYELYALCSISAEGIRMDDVCAAVPGEDLIQKEIPRSDKLVSKEEKSGRIKQFVLHEKEMYAGD